MLIENFFGKLMEFKRIATRADKTDKSSEAAVCHAAAVINSRSISTDASLNVPRGHSIAVEGDWYRQARADS